MSAPPPNLGWVPRFPPPPELPPSPQPYQQPQPSQPSNRRQSTMSTEGASINRRKASSLRQTSFPQTGDASDIAGTLGITRSPSVDTAQSLASASVADDAKKKRARKSKNPGDDESAVDGMAKSAVSGVSGGHKRKHSILSGDEEDEEGSEDMAVEMAAHTDAERQKEHENKAMLIQAMDSEQFQRYEAWRSAKLSDSVVRRICNQTLSQSVSADVVLAIRSVAKVYLGELIEGARKVQKERISTDSELKEAIRQEMLKHPQAFPESIMNQEMKLPRGPIEPEHLRESHRRHLMKKGGMVGNRGLSHQQHSSGVERFASEAGGKRLFK